MREVTEAEVLARMGFDNPWWESASIDSEFRSWPVRDYLDPYYRLLRESDVRRAVVLLGPRRVGKTILVYQAIQRLMDEGVPARSILYVSLETPVYTGLPLERLLQLFQKAFGHGRDDHLYIFFDEVQYLRDWEIHLKSLVDSFRRYRFSVTGSAAAALRLKSRESGAGRFSDFLLPPLTFAEYLRFANVDEDLISKLSFPLKELAQEQHSLSSQEIAALNEAFVRYINYGGYPEAVFSGSIQRDPGRYIRSDIIDKVLLRDLPSLYGIDDIQELNRLFTTLAYNTGSELSLDQLSQSASVAKNTLRRYLEYLEAAFLIKRVRRIDENARHFQRATAFKVYLTNPSMRAALFGLIDADDEAMGNLTETALFSQSFHEQDLRDNQLFYARWQRGDEVDMVWCRADDQRPEGAIEVKWSDRYVERPRDLKSLLAFAKRHELGHVIVTTRSRRQVIEIDGITLLFLPSSLFCYVFGRFAVASAIESMMRVRASGDEKR